MRRRCCCQAAHHWAHCRLAMHCSASVCSLRLRSCGNLHRLCWLLSLSQQQLRALVHCGFEEDGRPRELDQYERVEEQIKQSLQTHAPTTLCGPRFLAAPMHAFIEQATGAPQCPWLSNSSLRSTCVAWQPQTLSVGTMLCASEPLLWLHATQHPTHNTRTHCNTLRMLLTPGLEIEEIGVSGLRHPATIRMR